MQFRKYLLGVLLIFISACADSQNSNHQTNTDEPRKDEVNEFVGSHPTTDPDFHLLANGYSLFKMSVSGSALYFAKGSGTNFSDTKLLEFEALRKFTKENAEHSVQWALMNLDSGKMIEQSAGANRKIFGASVSKIFVAATLLNKQKGQLSSYQLQLMADMLVVSSNSAWTELQRQIGDGDADLGRKLNHEFTQAMGYKRTRGFQGWWGDLHGNELTAAETVQFMYDTYQNHYQGADTLWKLLHTVRTGSTRGRRYIGPEIHTAGKTGSYAGPTVDPETGKSKNPDGSDYTVNVKNHALSFRVNGTQYGLVVLANSGTNDSAALLMGGFYNIFKNNK